MCSFQQAKITNYYRPIGPAKYQKSFKEADVNWILNAVLYMAFHV